MLKKAIYFFVKFNQSFVKFNETLIEFYDQCDYEKLKIFFKSAKLTYSVRCFLFIYKQMETNQRIAISGSMTLTKELFDKYYKPKIIYYFDKDYDFMIGGASGTDTFAQTLLLELLSTAKIIDVYKKRVTICDKENEDNRITKEFNHVNNFKSFTERDEFMTNNTSIDIAFIYCDKQSKFCGGASGTVKNILRRKYGNKQADEIIKLLRDNSI